MLPVLRGIFLVFLLNVHTCGCIGKKLITKIRNAEDLCPKQQFIVITWSVVTTCQWGKWVFYIKFLLRFNSITTIEETKAKGVCDIFSSPRQLQKEREQHCWKTGVKTSPNTFQTCLLLRCHCQALQSDRHVPQALFKCRHQVSLKIQPYRSTLFSPRKTRTFLQVFKRTTSRAALFVV